jgi:hypothetical protein
MIMIPRGLRRGAILGTIAIAALAIYATPAVELYAAAIGESPEPRPAPVPRKPAPAPRPAPVPAPDAVNPPPATSTVPAPAPQTKTTPAKESGGITARQIWIGVGIAAGLAVLGGGGGGGGSTPNH